MKTYTITEIANTLNTHKNKIRRTLNDLGIEAENEHTRPHPNSPKRYSVNVRDLIINELRSETSDTEHNQDNSGHKQDSVEHNQTIKMQESMIGVLKEQLNIANHEKQDLIRALQEAQQLVNQQQQLSLQANSKVKALEIELKEKEQNRESTKKNLFSNFFSKDNK